ncbi:MAG TPA: membrane protein insertase YidC [Candidatus Acetothermia bacterium]|nr:membrane protein insertase YidC [Candidatus Acetothermia bacterium]
MLKRRAYLVFVLLIVIASFVALAGTTKDMTYKITKKGNFNEVTVRTALASYVFSENGGVLKSVYLAFASYGSKVVELVPGTKTDPKTLERQYVSNVVFPFTTTTGDGQPFTYTLVGVDQPTPDKLSVEFRGTAGDLTLDKKFVIYNNPYYTVDVEVSVENGSDQAGSVQMTVGDYTPVEKGRSLVYQFDNGAGSDLLAQGSYTSFNGVGLMDKKTVFFLKVNKGEGATPFVKREQSGNRRFGVDLAASPGTTSYSFSLYGGRRQYLLMEHSGLGTLDNPGTAARLMIPVIQFLNILYRYTGNYGWAILLFTLITRVILFPLMRKQYHSMAKMQKLQPRLKKIQERFKDDKQLMQQKLMEMYKKEGVNPMGGCLPMFVQLPILVLLWKAILYSATQIHLSPGFLWISDLSVRDPYFILVILTTGVMILQQKMMTPMTTTDAKGSQKYMGYMMPIFMAVFLYNFPAGLWFYYLLTTVLQVAQQYFVNWEMAKAEAESGSGVAEIVEDDAPEEIIGAGTSDDNTDRDGK